MHGSLVHEAAAETRLSKNFPLLFFFKVHLFRIASAAFSTGPPKGWFYTVYTHYCHSLLTADPVTHIFPAAGATQPGCASNMSSLCVVLNKRETERRREARRCQTRERDVSKYDSHLWDWSEEEKKGNKVKKECLCPSAEKKK